MRPIYAGNAILTVQSSDSQKIITVRGTAFPAPATDGGSAAIEEGVDPKAECPTEDALIAHELRASGELPADMMERDEKIRFEGRRQRAMR